MKKAENNDKNSQNIINEESIQVKYKTYTSHYYNFYSIFYLHKIIYCNSKRLIIVDLYCNINKQIYM
jgi:hypothetical protein